MADSNLKSLETTDEGIPPDRALLLIQPHIAEYEALMTRATYFITIMAGIWPLVLIFLGVSIQFWKTQNVSLNVAWNNLLQNHGQRAAMLWGTDAALQIVFLAWAQILSEQYNIVRYIEFDLRRLVRRVTRDPAFWQYEAFLTKQRGAKNSAPPTWMELAVSIGAGILIVILVFVLWPVSRWKQWDWIGLIANLMLFLFLLTMSVKAVRARRDWETKQAEGYAEA